MVDFAFVAFFQAKHAAGFVAHGPLPDLVWLPAVLFVQLFVIWFRHHCRCVPGYMCVWLKARLRLLSREYPAFLARRRHLR